MSAPDVDTTEVPKFDKLRPHLGGVKPGVIAWIDKLQAWCEEAVREQERLEKNVDEGRDTIDDLERAAAEQEKLEDVIERIEQRIEDTVRGIYSLDETADWLRRENR